MSALSHPVTSRRAHHVTCSGCGTRWRADNAPHSQHCPRCDWPLITRTWVPDSKGCFPRRSELDNAELASA